MVRCDVVMANDVTGPVPIVECPEAAEAARPGSDIAIDTDSGDVTVDGTTYAARPFPSFVLELAGSGGLMPWAQQRLEGESR